MKVNLSIWDKLTRVVILLLIVAGILLVAMWYLPLIKQNERMRQRILYLDTRIHQQEETYKRLHASEKALATNPKALERLIRERMGYAKPGEIIIHFEEAPTNKVARK